MQGCANMFELTPSCHPLDQACRRFYKLGVPLLDVLMIRALLVGVYSKAPDFWKLAMFPMCGLS